MSSEAADADDLGSSAADSTDTASVGSEGTVKASAPIGETAVPLWPTWARRAYAAATNASPTYVFVVWLGSVVLAIWLLEGSVFHPEMRVRIPLYLRRASLYSIIFDAAQDSIPRPRQVSFIFDVLDAYFVRACAHRGFPHFLSLTHYVFSLFIGLSLWRFLNRYVTKNRVISLLVVAMLLFSRFFEIGTFFRSAKIGAALVVALMLNVMADLLSQAPGWRGKTRKLAGYMAGMFALTSVGALFDEQSVAMTLACTVVLVGWSIVRRNAACAAGASGAALGLGFVVAYYRWIFPRVFASVNHSAMNYDFQTGVPKDVLTKSKIYWDSFELTLDTAGSVLGNMSRPQLVVAILVVLGVWFFRRKAPITITPGAVVQPADRWAILLFVLTLGALWVLNVGMVLKHPPVVWPDVRTVYYWLPAATCFAFLVPWIVARLSLLLPTAAPARRTTWTIVTLAGFVAINLVTLPAHYETLKAGHLKGDFAFTKKYLPALRDPEAARATFGREPVNDPVYMLLRNPHPPVR